MFKYYGQLSGIVLPFYVLQLYSCFISVQYRRGDVHQSGPGYHLLLETNDCAETPLKEETTAGAA